MSDEQKASVNTGSANDSANGANAGRSNNAQNNEGNKEMVPKEQYDSLFSKLGENSEEVGELRKVKEQFDELSPLLEKLEGNPDLIRAIMADKLTDTNLIKAVLEGSVSINDAQKVEKANEAVKEELGKKEYDKTSPEAIAKLIEEKIGGVKQDLEKTISSMKEEKELEKYEQRTEKFIKEHKDFAEHATEINKYMQEKDILDVSVAYDAVTGKKFREKVEKDNETAAKEEAKNIASNMGGGRSMRGAVIKDKKIVDALIAD